MPRSALVLLLSVVRAILAAAHVVTYRTAPRHQVLLEILEIDLQAGLDALLTENMEASDATNRSRTLPLSAQVAGVRQVGYHMAIGARTMPVV